MGPAGWPSSHRDSAPGPAPKRTRASGITPKVIPSRAVSPGHPAGLRVVAAEAGVSMGRVQHYFHSKDDLLLHSLEHAHQRMQARIEQRLTGTAGGDREVLVAVLDEMLGENPETREAIRITVAYAARALDDDRVAAVLTAGDAEIVALATAVIAQAREDRRVGQEVDPEREAHVLWALTCGLGAEVALYGASPATARAALEYHLRRIAPPVRAVPGARR